MGVSIVKEDNVAKVHVEGWAGFRQTGNVKEYAQVGRNSQLLGAASVVTLYGNNALQHLKVYNLHAHRPWK